MKLTRIILDFLRLRILKGQPGGLVPDKSAMYGLFALINNINAYVEGLVTIATTSGQDTTLTVAQFMAKNIVLTSGANGAFKINLPSTAAIFTALGQTIETNGTFFFPLYIANQGVGQTATLTAGDSSTTVSSTENTLATNTSGKWMVQVVTASTLQVTRVMSGTN